MILLTVVILLFYWLIYFMVAIDNSF